MERRRFIHSAMAASVIALAGCSSSSDDDGEYGGDDTGGTDQQTDAVTPEIRFDFSYDNVSEELTITFSRGDVVEAQTLSLGGDIEMEWTDSSSFSEGDSVSAGDSITVEAPPGATVQVLWNAEETDNSGVLDETVTGE